MTMMKIATSVGVACCLAACMSTSPNAFQAPSTTAHFVLDQDVIHKAKVGTGLSKGTYRAVFESSEFVYYRADDTALIIGPGNRFKGGIALARNEPACHLFIQFTGVAENTGGAVAALAKLEKGRIKEYPDDPECAAFLPHIRVMPG